MPYRAEISRASPTAILILIDQSTSMGHRLEAGPTKAAFLADVLNKTIYTVITNCSKADGVRDYFHLGVIAYSGEGARNGFQGVLAENVLHPISRLADHPIRIEQRIRRVAGPDDRIVDQQVKFPIWFEPRSRGRTSMCAGLRLAVEVLQEWSRAHPSSYPPTLLHVTDGHPTDGDPEPLATQIRAVVTEDGPTLVFNLHLDDRSQRPLLFPHSESAVGDKYGKRLFRMSSPLPAHVVSAARSRGHSIQSGARGFIFNAGAEAIVEFFDIGTRPVQAAPELGGAEHALSR